jgi:AraC-like DNA-binding protein
VAGVAAARADAESETARRIEQCICFMREHLNQPLQVATLAAKACASPSHFFVLFKRVTGSSPIDYFIRLRMRRACQLLEAGSLHVKEVAAALGYEDPFYFSRVFKSTIHVAPKEYRGMAAVAGRTRGNGVAGARERSGASQQFEISRRVGNNGWNKRIMREKSSILHSQNGFVQR